MKKTTSLILTLFLVGMAACSSSQKKEEPVVAVEEPAKVEVKVGQQVLGVAYFDTNVYNKIARKDFGDWKTVVEKLSATSGAITILVHGHTDRVGSEKYNKALSLKRAEFIKKELIQAGVSADKVVTEGFGFSKPVEEETDDKTGSAQNRRAEIIFDIKAQ